jgi:hypothetical protein
MAEVKDKLLTVLGNFAMDELSVNSLFEVLAARLKSQEEKILELHRENGRERQRLYDETESLMRKHAELRRNPGSIFCGPFFFAGDKGAKYFVQINRGRVEAFEEKKNGIQIVLQAISHTEYEAIK